MGNQVTCQDCAPADETLYKKQYGVINCSRNNELDKNIYYIDIHQTSESDLNRLKSQWTLISSLSTNFMKPVKIDIINEDKMFSSKRMLRVYLPIEEYTLAEYATQNLKINPLIPEIQLLNILSNVVDALFIFEKNGILHGNISPDTIMFDSRGQWRLSTPNFEHVSLQTRMRSGKENLMFLLAPEAKGKSLSANECAKADLFSLAVTILHSIDSFSDSKLSQSLTQSDLQAKLEFLNQYYSQTLVQLFASILVTEAQDRSSVEQLRERLDEMIDISANDPLLHK